MKTIQDIIEYIKVVHAGQVDKAGVDYWLHPYMVSKFAAELCDSFGIVYDKFSIIKCALLHDVLEDCDIDIDKFVQDCELTYDELAALKLLNHAKGISYSTYISKVSTSLIASIVKIADLKHNMDISRFAGIRELTDIDLKRLNKYLYHYDYLLKQLKQR